MDYFNKKIIRKILAKNRSFEEKYFSIYACKSNEADRLEKIEQYENPPDFEYKDNNDIRPAFFHDTDRIIHSLAYTRYIDKTQVFFLFENDHLTHRVLHVQFVSKIARTIGRCLNLNEDLIEAIALGHDLGHPPFGHDGERFLNNICKCNKWRIGYFVHNAQSVKHLLELEKRHDKTSSLNLSLQVLDGILCHNGEMLFDKGYIEPNKNKTWYNFLEEYNNCWTEEDYHKNLKPMTLEGCVVRIADKIAYVGRDLQDAIEIKLFDDNFLRGSTTLTDFLSALSISYHTNPHSSS